MIQFFRTREECSRLALALVVIIRDRVRARTFMVLRAGCQLEWVSFPWSSTRERIGLHKLAPRATWTPSCCYLSARSDSLLAFVLLLVGAIGRSSRHLDAFVLLPVGAIGLSSRHLDAFVLLLVGAIGLSSGLRAATCRRDRSLFSPLGRLRAATCRRDRSLFSPSGRLRAATRWARSVY